MNKFSKKASKLKHQEVFTNSKGETTKVCDMSEEQVRNVLNYILKREREDIEYKFKRCINREISGLDAGLSDTF